MSAALIPKQINQCILLLSLSCNLFFLSTLSVLRHHGSPWLWFFDFSSLLNTLFSWIILNPYQYTSDGQIRITSASSHLISTEFICPNWQLSWHFKVNMLKILLSSEPELLLLLLLLQSPTFLLPSALCIWKRTGRKNPESAVKKPCCFSRGPSSNS